MTLASAARSTAPGIALAVALALTATAMAPVPGWGSEPPPGAPTRLIEAIRRGDDTLLQSLLREGALPDAALEDGTTALMLAALHGSAKSVRLLLHHGADPGASNRAGATALIWGAGDPAKVRVLLEHGADPNARSKVGNTPLMVACRTPGATAAVKRLLDAGAESGGARAKNARGLSPLTNAAAAGNLEAVELLLDAKAVAATEKNRALARAAEIGHLGMVRVLLEAGADPNWDAGARTGHVLDTALLAEEHEVATLLLDHGADPTTPTQTGAVPPLLLATYTESGSPAVLQELLALGAPADAENARGESARGWAQRRGHQKLIDLLESHGAPPPSAPPKQKPVPDRGIELARGGGDPDQQVLRDTARRSLTLLQKSSDVFLANRESCVSCHHQNLPAVAFAWARDRGFRLDEESIDRLVDRQDRWMKPRTARAYELDQPTPVPPRLIGYGLLGHAALGRPSDPTIQALTYYLAATQQPDGHWSSSIRRPPMGGDEILATALATRAIQNYPPAGDPAEAARKVRLARRWLAGTAPSTHQEHVFKLLGLAWTGAGAGQMRPSRDALVAAQRDDGGWAQLPGLPSDAWATGQSLVALHTAGALGPADPAFVRGLEFLVNTQFDDGSWFVPTRSWPFQPHFDSQFPHGRDQWVSAGATAWATMAVVLAVEPFDDDFAQGSAPTPEPEPLPPPVAVADIDFAEHIHPILERSCTGCHGGERPKGNFRITGREALLRGGESGLPAVTPGDGASSPMVRQVKGLVEDMEMPPLTKREKYPALSGSEVALLEAWIDAGATWNASENPND